MNHFTQRNFSVCASPSEAGVILLRMPEGLPLPTGLETFLYEEQVTISDEEVEKTDAATSQKRKLRTLRPTMQWALEAGDRKLVGNLAPVGGEEMLGGSAYFLLATDDRKKETRFIPVRGVVALRPDVEAEEDDTVKHYLKTGRKPSADWQAKYERTINAFDADDGDEEEGADRGKKVRPRPRWRRMYRPDDDEAWDDPFNPVAKTGPSYNDIFDLNRSGDARDVIQVAFEDVDLGHDEIPDGAEDFFGAPEFGEEGLKAEEPKFVKATENDDAALYEEDSDAEKSSSEDEEGGRDGRRKESRKRQRDEDGMNGVVGADLQAGDGPASVVERRPENQVDTEIMEVDYDDDEDDDESDYDDDAVAEDVSVQYGSASVEGLVRSSANADDAAARNKRLKTEAS